MSLDDAPNIRLSCVGLRLASSGPRLAQRVVMSRSSVQRRRGATFLANLPDYGAVASTSPLIYLPQLPDSAGRLAASQRRCPWPSRPMTA